MKCPRCDVAFHEDAETWTDHFATTEGGDGRWLWACGVITCPECIGVIVCLGTTPYEYDTPKEWQIIYPGPATPEAKVSGEVPEALRGDYIEACQVASISAKASAALSRRVLQAMLNEQGYSQRNLYEQIQSVLAEKDPDKILPTGLRSLLEAVRRFGNFSAHPITDLTSLQIIDVEPAEADWCLRIIDALFDHYYVRPALDKRMLSDLDQKLQQAGINPIQPQNGT